MLTDLQTRKAEPRDKDYKLADTLGLYLFVTKAGAKSWRMKYRFANKEKRLTFGLYPEISLSSARASRDDARRLLRENKDPAIEKRKARLASADAADHLFEKLGRKWYENEKGRWSPVHASDVIRSLERDVFPDIGSLPISQINAPIILATLRGVECRGSIETAKRLRQRISAIFVYAISEGICETDPAAIIAKALKPMPKRGRQPAMTDIEALRTLLIKSEGSGAHPITKLVSRFLALTSQRPGTVRRAVWNEFEGIDWNGDGHVDALWRIPAARMKLILDRKDEVAFEHLVPLSDQAVAVLRATRRMTANCPFVFPGLRHTHRPISENAVGYLYNRVGYHGRHVPHGWRASFSTVMNERAEREDLHGDRKVIDLMLAHIPENKVEGAYNRAAFMPRRKELAQEWADMIMDGLIPASDLLEGPRR